MSVIARPASAVAGWRRLVLDAPPANVITRAMIGELRGALADLADDPDLKLVTIEGAGAHFSYGASVPEHLPPAVGDMLPEFHHLIRDLLAFPAPTAAIVRGRCLGGGFELTLACDTIFAGEGAQLGVPEVTLGVFPPAAAALLPLRVGASKAARAVLTGQVHAATAWYVDGLVADVVGGERLLGAVEEWYLKHLSPRSTVALRHAATASRAVLRMAGLPALALLEEQYMTALLATHDAIEGCAAFIEKRAPVWTNR
jgi:cyclohexa-1,5-dienecarbonyl-CoA hydratase